MNRRTRRTASMLRRRDWSDLERIAMAHTIGAERAKRSWFKPPAPGVVMSAGRVEIRGEARPELFVPEMPGSYGWAKDAARKAADLEVEHWADALLKCPTSPLNHRTARFAGKPYHWRQDYTGQLKLAAGESPW